MSDEFGRLKQAFRLQEEISAREDTRKLAISSAMKQFEEENLAKNTIPTQGLRTGSRLREHSKNILRALNWRRVMNFVQPNFKHVLAGGVSLAVLAIAIVNIEQIAPDLKSPLPTALEDKKKAALDNTKSDITKQKPVATGRLERDDNASLRGNSPSSSTAPEPQKREAEVDKLESTFGDAEVSAAPPQEVFSKDLRTEFRTPKLVQKKAGERVRSAKKSRQMQSIGGLAGKATTRNDFAIKGNESIAPRHYQDQGRDKFTIISPNPAKLVSEDPVSTFSVDVDTASYAFVRSSLNRGVLPQMDAVRIEELINYFNYAYKAPDDRAEPFSTNVSIMPTPWNVHTKLMRIGIKGFDLPKAQSPHVNLVFLIDTSGSMNAPDKLPLLRNSFKLLLASLKPDDTVAIVTYAGSAGTVLAPTKVADRNKILSALDHLSSGGSTAGAAGIHQAYQLAEQQLDKGGVNRVILATDGDFNVGITNPQELKNFVERKRNSGVTLSVLGFGHGNYNDQLMQALAQNGNGNAAYIDTLSEARKILVEQAGATLFTIAKDVKLQLEFNPDMISEYRLIGYETRQLKREDFNNDKIDAGDIGAGHSVTALYEFTPAGASNRLVDELRYQKKKASPSTVNKPIEKSDEYAFMKIRYKLPDSDTSKLITSPITHDLEASSIDNAPVNARFAAAVAAFGQILRGGRNTGAYSYDDVVELALSAKGEDRFGYRSEFINLVRLAKTAAALQPGKG